MSTDHIARETERMFGVVIVRIKPQNRIFSMLWPLNGAASSLRVKQRKKNLGYVSAPCRPEVPEKTLPRAPNIGPCYEKRSSASYTTPMPAAATLRTLA
jgi:hypothetical protein